VRARRGRAISTLCLLPGATLALLLAACASAPLPRLEPPPATLPDAEVQRRLEFITRRLEASKRHGQLWYGSWLAISGGSAAYGVVEAVLSNESGDRADGVGGAILGVIGAGYVLFYPLDARHGAGPLRALPAATPAERRALLERAQEILQANAERAHIASSSWTAHLLGACLGVVAGGAVWGASGDARPAVITGVTEILGSEVQFWTEPLAPEQDLRDYVKEFGLGPPQSTRRWRLVPEAGGFALRLDF
jgi:hypothetical protein